MAEVEVAATISPEKLVGRLAAFGLHSLTVYVWAIHFAPWLVGRWFAWGAPIFWRSIVVQPSDWYLQHLELVSTLPLLVVGYFAARGRDSVATWAWAVPALVLLYKILQYHPGSSVLVSPPISAISYFFDIRHSMPRMDNLSASDPVRVLAQMTITAPFYAGVAYSLGALASKQNLLRRVVPSVSQDDRLGTREGQ
jgi:hypothetical protein